MQPNDREKQKEPERPNPGDPGVEVPDPDETKRVDPREDERIPELERLDGPAPKDENQGESAIDPRVAVDMPVRAGGGERLGRVEAVDERGIHLGGGLVAPWSDLIEVREGDVFVSGHRPDIGERVEESPRH